MRLISTKTNTATTYYVIKSFRDSNGKSTTKTVERLGTINEIRERCGDEEPIEWAKNYVKHLTLQEKEEKREVNVKYLPSQLISKYEQRSYNGGYLFLQKIYHDLGLHRICDTIVKRQHKDYKNHDIRYDLNGILSMLLYTRILYPGSKLSSLEDAKRFIEQPQAELHQVYRVLSLLSKESEFIREQEA